MRAVKCPKCQAMCLLAMVDGFKAAVDPTPLGVGGVRETVMAGRSVYGKVNGFMGRDMARRLRGLKLLTASTLGAHLREANPVLGEHVCGNAAFSGVSIDAPPKALSGPSATSEGLAGGFPPSGAREGSSGPPVASSHQPAATSATRHPSETAAILNTMDPWATPTELLRDHLGATVVSIEVEGRNVYSRK